MYIYTHRNYRYGRLPHSSSNANHSQNLYLRPFSLHGSRHFLEKVLFCFLARDVVDMTYIYTWNLFVLYFGVSTLQNKVFSNQNKGRLGSVYIYLS